MTITEKTLHIVAKMFPKRLQEYAKHVFKWEVFSERILENPIIIQHLPRKKSVILDVGSRYSQVPLEMASLGHTVYTLDIQNYLFKHKNLTFIKEDIRHTSFSDNFFDVATIISTLEHVGMGKTSYGDLEDKNGDVAAMKELSRILKPSGIILLTVPFGKAKFLPFMRVYDKKRIEKITKYFKVVEQIYMYNDNENWEISTYNKIKDIENTHHTVGNAFFLLRNKKKK